MAKCHELSILRALTGIKDKTKLNIRVGNERKEEEKSLRRRGSGMGRELGDGPAIFGSGLYRNIDIVKVKV